MSVFGGQTQGPKQSNMKFKAFCARLVEHVENQRTYLSLKRVLNGQTRHQSEKRLLSRPHFGVFNAKSKQLSSLRIRVSYLGDHSS